MDCRRFQDLADSYLAEELLVETNHEIIRHLESCPACRTELAARRHVRTTLRSAFTRTNDLRPAADLDARVRARLQQSMAASAAGAAPPPRVRWFGIGRRWAIAAALVIAGALTLTSTSGTWFGPAPAAAGRALQEAAADAAGDHEACAVNNAQPERLALDEAGRRFDPAYAGLVDVLQQTLPADRAAAPRLTPISVVEGHSCVFQGRRFGHVTMTRAGRLASVLVTNVLRGPHGGLPRPGALTGGPRDSARRVNVCAARAGFRVACFRAPRHAVFVVSDLGEQDNLALARAMAPALQRHLAQAGPTGAGAPASGLNDRHFDGPRLDSIRLEGAALVNASLADVSRRHGIMDPGLGALWTFSSRNPAIVLDEAAFFDEAFGVTPAPASDALSGS